MFWVAVFMVFLALHFRGVLSLARKSDLAYLIILNGALKSKLDVAGKICSKLEVVVVKVMFFLTSQT